VSRTDEVGGDRKSKAASPVLITDPEERARREVDNGLRQFDAVLAIVEQYRDEKRDFKLRLSTILTLHRFALDGIGTLPATSGRLEWRSVEASMNPSERTWLQSTSRPCAIT
jgi:hypothetical protein